MIFISITFIGFAGILHGAREAYHADAGVLENIIPNTNRDFFGRLSWMGKYMNWPADKRYKSQLAKYFPLDFWHVSKWIYTALLITGTILAPYDPLITGTGAYCLQAATAHATYYLLRKNSPTV